MKSKRYKKLPEKTFDLKSETIDKDKQFLKWLKPNKTQYTWGDVTDKILKLSEKIRSLIVEGDRCLILSENRPYWLISDIAVMNAGGISVPIFTTYSSNDYEYIFIKFYVII